MQFLLHFFLQFLLLSGTDCATGVGGQFFVVFWCCLGCISGAVLATFRYSFCGCFGAVLAVSGTDSAGIGGQFSAAFRCSFYGIFGVGFATFLYRFRGCRGPVSCSNSGVVLLHFWCSFCYSPVQLLGCSGAVFNCNSGAIFCAFQVKFLLFSGTDLEEVGGQFSAALWCSFCCISGAVFTAFRY